MKNVTKSAVFFAFLAAVGQAGLKNRLAQLNLESALGAEASDCALPALPAFPFCNCTPPAPPTLGALGFGNSTGFLESAVVSANELVSVVPDTEVTSTCNSQCCACAVSSNSA